MTVSNIHSNQVGKPLSYDYQPVAKRLGGTAEGGNSVAAWYEQAYTYYNAVMSGAEAKPDAAEWNAFLDQRNWAYSQIQGASSSYGEEFDMEMNPVEPSDGDFGDMGGSADPFGGQPGPNGNLVYTESETRLGFIGEERPMDIWATEFTLDVSSAAASTTFEKTTDTRFSPAEEVYKMIVTDKATGKTSTYFLHDIASITSIRINTPNGMKVTGHETYPNVTVGKYKKPSDAEAQPEVNAPIREEGDYNVVELPLGSEPVQITPQGGGGEGDVQKWKILADFNMNLMPSDTVAFSKDPVTGVVTIEVTHSDKSKDIYEIEKSFQGNVNALEDKVTGYTGIDNVTLNVGGVNGSEELPEDATEPDSTSGKVATYDNSKDVDVYSYDGYTDHIIKLPKDGTATIHGASYADKMEIVDYQEGPPQNWTIKVYKDGDTANATEYHITGGEGAKVILDVADASSVVKADGTPDTNLVHLAGVQIGLEATGSGLDILDNFTTMTNKTEADVLAEVYRHYPEYDTNRDGKLSRNELANQMELKNFPPSTPDDRFWELLYNLDPELKTALDEFEKTQDDYDNMGTWSGYDQNASDGDYAQVRDRIVQLLSVLYPDKEVTAVVGDSDNIMFGGVQYDMVDEGDWHQENEGAASDNWDLMHMAEENS